MIFILGLAAVLATFLGGLVAIKYTDKLHITLGFSAGAIIGVAFFDLIPEALELAGADFETSTVTSIIALGFVIFMILDRFIFLHSHHTDHEIEIGHDHIPKTNTQRRGLLGAGSLSIHSFLDGVAIGLAFQVSLTVGIVVAIAVLMHDFSDGMNTANMILKNGGSKKTALKWLAVDSVAPLLGVISTLFFTVPASILGLILAVFAGFFIYIGASDLLPESHHTHPTVWTTVSTILGMTVLYFAITLAGV